jgi:hypothetical protein
MCQQWFSMGGLLLDVIGFLMIAREWYWAINLQGAEKIDERMSAGDDTDDWKYRWQGWLQQYKIRTWLFKAGAVLIVLGFIGQSIGSFPFGQSWLHLKSCS